MLPANRTDARFRRVGAAPAPWRRACLTLLATLWPAIGAAPAVAASDAGFRLEAGAAVLQLTPSVRIGNAWHAASVPQCWTDGIGQHCPLTVDGSALPSGIVHLTQHGAALTLSYTATLPQTLQGLALNGCLRLPGARGWLSNGFQSWSQTGVIRLGPTPTEAATTAAWSQTGEDEVYRRGRELSWWYSFAGGGDTAFVAGATTAHTFKSWVQLSQAAAPQAACVPSGGSPDGADATDQLVVSLVSGAGESLPMLPATTVFGEDWYLFLGPHGALQDAFSAYGHALHTRHDRQPVAPLIGWNSWYDLWQGVKESDILANAAAYAKTDLPALSGSHGPAWIVLDDGWEKRWGDWYTNDKFPRGLTGLATAVAEQGLHLGLWIAPLLVAPDSDVARQHPDWLVAGVSYQHPTGTFQVLDVTKPEAAAHLQATIRRLTSAGIGLLKIDFLFSGALEGERFLPVTGMQAYELALQLIRAAAGEDTLLVAVGAPPLTTLSYADGWRVGGDIAFSPAIFGFPPPNFAFIANQARSLAGRQPFCLATLCDADPMLLRWPQPEDQVRTGMWVAAATGSALFLSDDLTKLDADRLAWANDASFLRVGVSGAPARLADYFPATIPDELVNMKDGLFTAEHAVPNVWLLPDGRRIGINFSWSEQTVDGTQLPPHSSQVLAR